MIQTGGVETHLDPACQCATLCLDGSLDEMSAPVLRDRMLAAIDRGYRDVIVDLSDASVVTSTGIGALISGLRRFGDERGRIVLAGCSLVQQSLLKMAGLKQIFPFYESVADAKSALFEQAEQVFEPRRENSARLRLWLRSLGCSAQITCAEREAVEAAASEAFTNAVEHTGPGVPSKVKVRACLGSAFTVEIQDQGPGFQARQYFNVDPESLHTGRRGLGIHVMRNLMDQVEFVSGGTAPPGETPGTTVRLVKRLQLPGLPAQGRRSP